MVITYRNAPIEKSEKQKPHSRLSKLGNLFFAGKGAEKPKHNYKETFGRGAILTAKDFDGTKEEANFIVDHGILFGVLKGNVEELHIVNGFSDEDIFGGGWPIAYAEEGKVVLESSFGFGKEDKIVANSVFVSSIQGN